MPDLIRVVESSGSGFSASVALGRDQAQHLGFTEQSEAELWSMRMARKIEKQQQKIRAVSCVPREFDMLVRQFSFDS